MNNKKRLIIFLNEHNISKYELKYYHKVFGNFVLTFEYECIKYTLINDRGDIILNDKIIADHSYLETGLLPVDMAKEKILEIIQQNQT